MNLLTVRQLSKAYGPRLLFKNAQFSIREGEKIGVVGNNGSGKSTLFRILAGLESPDEGEILRRRGMRWALMDQHPSFKPGQTPQQIVAQALLPLRKAIAEYERLNTAIEQASEAELSKLFEAQVKAQNLIEQWGGWNWEHRVKDMLQLLGIGPEIFELPIESCSGGQRRRVALAKVLLEAPDLLLLDEPTNHLDTETIEHLEVILSQYPKSLLLTTHDRYFLDRIVHRIIEVHVDGVFSHMGSYRTFMEHKVQRMEIQARTEARRQKKLAQELEWLRRAPKARGTKAKSRIKEVQALREKGASGLEERLDLGFQSGGYLGHTILRVENLGKKYGDRWLFTQAEWMLKKKDKVAIIGPNGCGKSTLLKLLAQKIKPDQGQVHWGKNTILSYLDQERSDLKDDQTIFESLGQGDFVYLNGQKVNKYGYLRKFLFAYEEQHKKVKLLSGGERCRLLLAKIMLTQANVLLLDEPTNDLDIASLQALEDALLDFDGCVLLVTHDRYLINRLCNAVLAYEDGHWIRYDGDYDFYRAHRAAQPKEVKKKSKEKREKKKKIKLSWKESQELEQIEDCIARAEDQKAELEEKLLDPSLYQGDYKAIQEIQTRLQEVEAEIERLYQRWEYLEARREAMLRGDEAP